MANIWPICHGLLNFEKTVKSVMVDIWKKTEDSFEFRQTSPNFGNFDFKRKRDQHFVDRFVKVYENSRCDRCKRVEESLGFFLS